MIPNNFKWTLVTEVSSIDGILLFNKGDTITAESPTYVSQKAKNKKSHTIKFADSKMFEEFKKIIYGDRHYKIFKKANLSNILHDIENIHISSDIELEFSLMYEKDPYTYTHVLTVTALTAVVAQKMEYSSEYTTSLAKAALLHDFGKMRISPDILHSKTKLPHDKYMQIYQHPLVGHLLLTYYLGSPSDRASKTALLHHEKRNGSGYPMGIKQEDPDIGLITVNDMYDALLSPRVYRKDPFDIRGALDLLWDEVLLGAVPEMPVRYLIALNRTAEPQDIKTMPVHKEKRGHTPKENNYGPEE